MSKYSIRTVEAASRRLTFIGGDSTCGTYVLRLRLNAPTTISCGRFMRGKLIAFEPGDYLYVGSALGEDRSPTCLARRLVRHATRLGEYQPHRIRKLMLAEFHRIGMAPYDLSPTKPKKPQWNVNYVLDQPCAELIDVYVIRTPARAEASIGKYLETDATTAVIEPGLGANDIKGNTHLMRAAGDEQWWQQLPKGLLTVAKLAAVHGDQTVRNALEGVRHAGWKITGKKLGKLTRMTPERAADILRRLATGQAYTRANRESQAIFDTTGWAEVKSRLGRGRGSVILSATILEERGDDIVKSSQQWQQITALALQLKHETAALRRPVTQIADNALANAGQCDAVDASKRLTFNQLAGNLTQCIKFVIKSNRDIPALTMRPTGAQLDRMLSDLTRIESACDRIVRMCSRKEAA